MNEGAMKCNYLQKIQIYCPNTIKKRKQFLKIDEPMTNFAEIIFY